MAAVYESMLALNPNMEKEALANLMDGFKGVITGHGGTLVSEKELGKKKFAYTVRKFSTGYYYLLYYSAPPETVFELERSFKHSEDVLKFLTVRLDEEELKLSLSLADTMAPVSKEESDGHAIH
jgi:small subunit ribosomal protein S6